MGICTSNIATLKVVDNTSNESITGISPADIFATEYAKNSSLSSQPIGDGSKTTNTKNKAPNILFDQSDRTACMSISNRDDDDPLVHTTTNNNTNEDVYEYTGKGKIPKDVTSIKLHRSITSLPDNTFFECTNLQSVILNEGLVSIGNKAFANCTSLECIRIPSTVTSIGSDAFSHCTSLKEVTFKYSKKLHFGKRAYDGSLSIGQRAFSGCTSLASIFIPPTLSVIYDELFTDCDCLKEIAFSEGIEKLGRCSFGGCVSLESISFPSSLTDIGEDAFRNCTKLKEVTFNEGLQKVGRCSFGGCKALEQIKLPSSIEVGKWAFRDCIQLTKVELGTQQRSIINQHTFAGCTKLDKSMIRTMMMVTYKMKGCLDLNTSTSLESVSLITYDEDDTTIDTKFTDETPVLERTSSERKKKKKKSRKDGAMIDDSERSGESNHRSRRRKHKKSKSSSKLIDESDRSGKSKGSDSSRRRKHHRKSKSRRKVDKSERSSGKSRISNQVGASIKSEKSEISGIW